MNTQYKKVVKAFESANGSYGTAVALLRVVVGNTDTSTVKHAAHQEKAWQSFLTSGEYKAADTAAQDLMRKCMQRIRAKCGYTADRAGKIAVKKTVARGTKSRDAGSDSEPAKEQHSVASVANPVEAARIVGAIAEWKTALGAVIDAFGSDIPPAILTTLRSAIFGIAKEPVKVKAKA